MAGSTTDSDRRGELAELVADYFIETGNVRESLRDLAPSVGSSARMLLHYFESRESLVAAALEVARARQLAAASNVLASAFDVEDLLHKLWRWYKRADTQQFFVLFNDVAALEQSSPVRERRFGSRFATDWRPMFEPVFKADPRYASDAKPLTRLVIATIRGLALDLRNGVEPKDQRTTYFALVHLIVDR